jgi:hypothetical protein
MITPFFTMLWGEAGQAMVPAYDDLTSLYVPANEIWIVEAAGVVMDRNIAPVDFKLQYQVKPADNSNAGWLVPLHVNVGKMDTTPVLALDRRVVLPPHTRISARVAWGETEAKMALLLAGFKLEYSPENLDRVVLGGGGATVGTPVTPDLTDFITQCQNAAAALANIQIP